MTWYVGRRVLTGFILFLGLLTLSFGLVSMLPGSPSKAILGQYATPEAVAQLNAKLGLDEPLVTRYFTYMAHAFHGDLGSSFFSGRPVLDDLLMRVPNTLIYLVPGLVLALVLGIAIGSIAAYRYRGPADRAFTVGSSILLAVPEFVLALVLIIVFFQMLRIAAAPLGMTSSAVAQPPTVTGSVVIDSVLGGYWATGWSIVQHAILPTVTIGVFFSAPFAKVVRTGMVQALASPQIEFARACGLKRSQVFRYAIVDSRSTILTYFVIMFASALSGATIVESVFSWPGVGGWALQGVLSNDIPVIQGFVVVMGTASLAGYIILDIVITVLDPRTRSAVRGTRRVRTISGSKVDIMKSNSI